MVFPIEYSIAKDENMAVQGAPLYHNLPKCFWANSHVKGFFIDLFVRNPFVLLMYLGGEVKYFFPTKYIAHGIINVTRNMYIQNNMLTAPF